MQCPTCATDVPSARFCARCGDRLADAPSPPPVPQDATRTFLPSPAGKRSSSVVGAGMLFTVALVAAAGMLWVGPDRPAADDDVAVPTAVARQPVAAPPTTDGPAFVASPSATVLCSDMSEHRVEYAWLDDADLGDAVDVHGTPCIVTEIDVDARPRGYPRGVARGNRPGTGPVPRR